MNYIFWSIYKGFYSKGAERRSNFMHGAGARALPTSVCMYISI